MSIFLDTLLRLYALLGTAAFFLYDAGLIFQGQALPERLWVSLLTAPLLLVVLLMSEEFGLFSEATSAATAEEAQD